MDRSWILRVGSMAAVAGLVACGGGGGGSGGIAGFPIAGAPNSSAGTGAGSGSVASNMVTLIGTASFESVPNASGRLDYASSTYKPVRGAAVDILSNAVVIASTTTDEAGNYSVAVPANSSIVVRVKAQLAKSGSGASWDVSVRDNTQSNALYAMESPAFATGTDPVLRNLQAPSGWSGMGYGSRRVAGPFAILDAVYTAQNKVLSVAPTTAFPPLQLFWSVDNVPATGSEAAGQIGTTFFRASGNARSIFVLGKENVDTDEYDVSVVTHEWGHYYQSAFSRDDSPGGDHALANLLDRRVAFSEGWGNAWSGIALERSNYTDSVGASQAQGSNIDLTRGPTTNPGWYREGSIQSVLWNFNAQAGFKPIHDTMTGAFRTTVPVTSIHSFAASLFATAPASAPAFNSLLAAQSISAAPNDPYGTSETRDGGVPLALPMYATATVGAATTACVTNQAGSANKLGNYAYLRFTAPTARNYTIVVSGSSLQDPDFEVYQGRLIVRAEGTGASETAAPALAAGEHVLAINDFKNTNVCFNVNIQ